MKDEQVAACAGKAISLPRLLQTRSLDLSTSVLRRATSLVQHGQNPLGPAMHRVGMLAARSTCGTIAQRRIHMHDDVAINVLRTN